METARVLKLVCVFFCIVSLIRTIKANNNIDEEINYDDEYWANKTNEARKHTLLAYHPDPYDIVDHFHERHYDNSSDVEEVKAAAEEDMIDMISSSLTTNSTRRSLSGTHHRRGKRGKWSKLKGPCTASNPIDKCWRCQPHWARRRKKLADCVRGFGYRTTGGKSGRIYVVTSNKDDDMVNPKQGTLRHAVIQKEPLWIIFKNDMHIRLSQELMINSHKTIDARGAKVHIAYGAGITIQYVQNIIIHGLRIHHIIKSSGGLIRDTIEHFGLRGEADGDGITIFGATNVWLDHISMSKCQDGLIDAVMGSTGITISNSHFTHHNDVMLLGAQNDNKDDKKMQVTVAFNHFGKGLVQRMPRIRWGFVHVVNNDYTHWELYAIGGSQAPTILSHGNRFIAPPHKLHCNEVTKRDYASEGEWKNWNWRSEKDIFMNKAYFRQSGNPHFKCSHSRQQMIQPKHGLFVSKLTKYAGALDCRLGKAC